MTDNWADVQAEWDEYDIADLETGEASGLSHNIRGSTETADKVQGGLMGWLRRLLGGTNVEDRTPSTD